MARILVAANKISEERNLSDRIALNTGSMLSYDNLIDADQGAEVQAFKLNADLQRKKIRGCLMLPLSFVFFCLYSGLVSLHEDIANTFLLESEIRNTVDDLFGEVEDIESLWDTLLDADEGFITSFFQQEDSYGHPLPKSIGPDDKFGLWGRLQTYSQLVGAVRFESSRRNSKSYGLDYTCASNITCSLCRSNAGLQPISAGSGGNFWCGDWQYVAPPFNETGDTIVTGSMGFILTGASAAEVETAAKASLALTLNIAESLLVVTVTSVRRLDSARRLATTWTVSYEAAVPATQAAKLMDAVLGISANPAGFTTNFVAKLKEGGVDAATVASLTVLSFSEPALRIEAPTGCGNDSNDSNSDDSNDSKNGNGTDGNASTDANASEDANAGDDGNASNGSIECITNGSNSSRKLAEVLQEFEELKRRRLGAWSPGFHDILPYRPSGSSEDLYRFYIYPSESTDQIAERLQYFRDRQWLDKETATFSIRMFIANAELTQPVIEQLTITFFFSEGGSMYLQKDLQAIFLWVFPSDLCMYMDGLWFIIWCFTIGLTLSTVYRSVKEATISEDLQNIKFVLEIIVLIVGAIFVSLFYEVTMAKLVYGDVAGEIRQHGWNLGSEQEDLINELFRTGDDVVEKYRTIRQLFSNYSLLLMFRFFANFGAQPRLAIVTRTLYALLKDLLHFLVVFTPVFFVYVTSAVLLFGRRLEGFATFQASLGSIYRMTQEGEYEWGDFIFEYYYSSAIWMWSFVVFVNMLFINLVLAIILDVYNEVRLQETTMEAVWSTVGQFWSRLVNVRRWYNEKNILKEMRVNQQPDVLEKSTVMDTFPGMPEAQVELLFRQSYRMMEVEAEKDLEMDPLLKMASSFMETCSTVNSSLRTITAEEQQDSITSWVVPKRDKTFDLLNPETENYKLVECGIKGSKKPRMSLPDENDAFDTENMFTWSPDWLREVDLMLKLQRQWTTHANWQLDQLQWNLQHANTAYKKKMEAQNPQL